MKENKEQQHYMKKRSYGKISSGRMDNYLYNTSRNGRVIDKNLIPYTAVSIDPELDFDLSGISSSKPLLSGPIRPFQKRNNNLYGKLRTLLKNVSNSKACRKSLLLIIINVLVVAFVTSWCYSVNSTALDGLKLLICFDLMTLVISLIQNIHEASQQQHVIIAANHERFQTLLVFSSLIFTMVGSIFIYKQAFLRILNQPQIYVDKLIPGSLILFSFHLFKMAAIQIRPIQSLCQASPSSLIQEHIADMSTTICSIFPSLTKLLLPRMNPFVIMTSLSTIFIFITQILIEIDSFYLADTISGLLIATTVICSMIPLASSSGRVLLNTVPTYVIGQLDKLLSEAQTLDGVLEIRNEKFHTIALSVNTNKSSNSFGLILSGTLDVRVRRDADPQMVLAHVYNRLSPMINQLTIQVVKDEQWPLQQTTTPPRTKIPNHNHKLMTTPSLKPTATVAPYQPVMSQLRDNSVAKKTTTATTEMFDFISPPKPRQPMTSHYHPMTSSASSPGENIAKMYRSAGFRAPPQNSPYPPPSGMKQFSTGSRR